MFYYLSQWTDLFSPLNLFRYITFRALCGAGSAFLLCVFLGPPMIRRLRAWKIGQHVRDDAVLSAHFGKAGTPTMGGVLIVIAVTVSTLLWAIPTSMLVILTLATMLAMGAIGFYDDYLKLTKKNTKGLSARTKLLGQSLWALAVLGVLWSDDALRPLADQLTAPFFKDPILLHMGFLGALIFIYLVLVGCTNAVNLTDGLDGLAAGCSGSVALAYLIMAYTTGHVIFASYLQLPYVEGAGELAVFCGCLLGGVLGFLWYNCHPAQVFMGDTGSLAIGGAIAMVAILIQQELTLVLVGGVFVMEALSVLLQVAYFRMTGGRRIFKCAPIHHHFEIVEKERAAEEGRAVSVVETMITTRFWILSIIFALLGVATLKIR